MTKEQSKMRQIGEPVRKKSLLLGNVLVSVLFLAMSLPYAMGQRAVSYVHEPFSEQGCVVIMAPALSGQAACLVVSVQSENLSLGEEVRLEMETMDGETILLEGMSLGLMVRLGLPLASGILHPEGMERQAAQFYLDGNSIRLLEKGIRLVRLDTRPVVHERTFRKDKVGKKLFKAFRSLGVILK